MARRKSSTSDTLKKLNDYQHARLRTEMYLGSREPHTQEVLHFDGERLVMREFTWVPALYTGLRELIDNALDEMVGHGHGDTLRVDYHDDPAAMIFTVSDNGRGLPINEVPKLGKGPAASILLGEARAGRNFAERGEVAGTNGLGAACTNFTAEWFELDVYHGSRRLKQRWEEGRYRGEDKHKTRGPNIIRGSKSKHGTTITYCPSAKVFPHMVLPSDFVKGRLWDIAVANPKLKVFYNGERLATKNTSDPIKSTYFADMPVAKVEFHGDGIDSIFYLSPGFNGDDEVFHSVVNNLPALQGGSHIEAFRNLFYPEAMNHLTGTRGNRFTKEKLTLTRADVASGLLIFNVTKMDGPNFDSQTKSRLVTEVKKPMRDCFDPFEVGSAFRRNPQWIEAILERCRRRTSTKEDQEVRRTQKKLSRNKIAKLSDAIGADRTKCVLFLGEGDSALNKMMNVRDPEVHGCLPLRGKILNVHGVTPKKVIASQALLDIMTAVGLQIGEKANSLHLRYGAIYIATDEDEDGKNITALLVNFLYRFWPELFQGEFVFKFSTPFIILEKGKQRKYIYADDYDDFQANLGKYKGWTVTRAKGLGALEEEDWVHSLSKPALIPIVDDGELAETLDLIFNQNRADDRKEWLSHE